MINVDLILFHKITILCLTGCECRSSGSCVSGQDVGHAKADRQVTLETI